jgi:3-oxoacyl-[acyl-carrier protein] reductase
MSDFLLELGQNPNARKLIKTLGLPLPIPQTLRRADGPWEERPLHDYDVAVGAAGKGSLLPVIAETLTGSGANPHVVGDKAAAPFASPGEAYGRRPKPLDLAAVPETAMFDGLVFDASDLADIAGLRAIYDFFHPLIGQTVKCARAIVIGRAAEQAKNPEQAAARAALEGFVRSLAKELGKRGGTAQLLVVEDGADARLAGPLRFVLSARSAFVSGQPVRVNALAQQKGKPEYVHALEGKVALVTGAARGIGEATARLLADEGAHVICLDRPDDDALVSKVARDIGGSVLLVDITDAEAPKKIAEELKARHGGLDIIIHNAGVTRDKTLAKMSESAWDSAVDINLGAVARITGALLEKNLVKDDGRIICLSSVAGLAGNLGQTNYSASKAGIVGYIKALAPKLAGKGITVNAVAPGFIETRLTAAIPVMIREAGRRLSNLGQGGQPRDVGEALLFLSTPAASGISGSVLRVCGGAFIGA